MKPLTRLISYPTQQEALPTHPPVLRRPGTDPVLEVGQGPGPAQPTVRQPVLRRDACWGERLPLLRRLAARAGQGPLAPTTGLVLGVFCPRSIEHCREVLVHFAREVC